MTGKLFIVNSYHLKARYVPMGAFGMCDYQAPQAHDRLVSWLELLWIYLGNC